MTDTDPKFEEVKEALREVADKAINGPVPMAKNSVGALHKLLLAAYHEGRRINACSEEEALRCTQMCLHEIHGSPSDFVQVSRPYPLAEVMARDPSDLIAEKGEPVCREGTRYRAEFVVASVRETLARFEARIDDILPSVDRRLEEMARQINSLHGNARDHLSGRVQHLEEALLPRDAVRDQEEE